MNPSLGHLFSRRSVRKYAQKPVEKALIRDLLEAAMAAPSACAKDPWRFVVLQRREILDRLADGLPNGQMLRQAPLCVVVCGDEAAAHDRQESYLLQDCSAAIQNILLAADALGLGACWLGVHPRRERIQHVRALLNLPASIVPVSAISIGWPADRPPARTRFREDAIHWETW
jgi:nitroreductase